MYYKTTRKRLKDTKKTPKQFTNIEHILT